MTALSLALLWFAHDAPLAFALVAVSGVGQVVVDVLSVTLLQRSIANEVTGRVFGIFDALTVGAMIVGSLLLAPLRGVFGFGPMLLVVAVAGPLLVIAQFRSLLAADREAAITGARIGRAVDDLRRVSLFASLREGALERLARGATRERFAVGDTVLLEGELGTHCYTVLHGRVDVRRGGADAEIIATLHEDDHFGEIGLLRNVPRTASVTAASDSVLYAIDAETFKSALETDAMVASQAFESATSRLSMLNN